MRGKYSSLLFLVVPALCISIVAPALGAAKPDEQFISGDIVESWPIPTGKLGLYYEDNIDNLRMPTLLYGYNKEKTGAASATSFCTSLEDSACASAEYVKYYSLLAPCNSGADRDCIESVYAIADGSPAIVQGSVDQILPSKVKRSYAGDVNYGLPSAANSSIWTLPGIKNGGGSEKYALVFSRTGSLQRSGNGWVALTPGTDGWLNGDFRAALFPVTMINDARYKENDAVINLYTEPSGNSRYSVGINHPSLLNFEPCAIVADGACAMREAFPADVQFGVKVRLSKKIIGWMHGRIDNPQIQYQVGVNGTDLDVRGYSLKVPIAGGLLTKDAIPRQDQDRLGISGASTGGINFTGTVGTFAMTSLSTFGKYVTDKAVAYPSQWGFYDLAQNELQNSSPCIKDSKKLAGFVTTNSTTYAAGPPEFNQANQSLDYKVSSLHNLANGDVFKGSYDLYIASDVARCIYKFSDAPISATISIVNESGVNNIATTVVAEKNGWIHLFARAFTFSEPTIRVKLTQEPAAKPIEAKETPTPKPSASSKRSTITCIKGRLKTQIIAVSPKCPSGYKKVA